MSHAEQEPTVHSQRLDKETKHDRYQNFAEIGAIIAKVVAVHERHQANKHPEEAAKHRLRGQVADAIAIGVDLLALK
eukprot:c22200_g1_i1 orf=459-689(-)